MHSKLVLVLVGAVLASSPVGSALAGPADASCVYLAQGCREPTLRPLIPLLSTDLPANNPGQAMPPAPLFPAPIADRRHRRHGHRTLVRLSARSRRAAGAAVAVLSAAGGASTSWASLGVVSAGIGLVTVLGEIARRTLLAVSR